MGDGIKWYDETGTITPEQFKASVSGTTKAELFARYMDAKAERDEARALVRELLTEHRKLLTLTKYELEGTGNDERHPWKRRIERGDAVVTKARASGYTEEGE